MQSIVAFFNESNFVCSQDGITVEANGIENHFCGSVVAFLADTLAAHEVGGFKIGVGFALRKCKICLATQDTMQTKVQYLHSVNITLLQYVTIQFIERAFNTKRAQTPQEVCEDPLFYCTTENNSLKLKHEHHYYHQVQQRLYVSEDLFSWWDFCVFTTKGCLVTRITLDDKWVEECAAKLL